MKNTWRITVAGHPIEITGLTKIEALLLARAVMSLTRRPTYLHPVQPVSKAIRRAKPKSRSA